MERRAKRHLAGRANRTRRQSGPYVRVVRRIELQLTPGDGLGLARVAPPARSSANTPDPLPEQPEGIKDSRIALQRHLCLEAPGENARDHGAFCRIRRL